MPMDFPTYKILVEALIKQHNYEHDLIGTIYDVTKKYRGLTDFIGLPYDSSILVTAIEEAIRRFDKYETTEYFLYECNGKFDEFNRNIMWEEEGEKVNPNCHTLEDLYNYIVKENS